VAITIALAGDTMVGPGVAAALGHRPPDSFFSPDLVDIVHEADLCILNLECCISDRGTPWPSPGKPFFFRSPPRAVEILNHLGVDCVNLANNHVLDFGYEALLDTCAHLGAAGIQWVGAGPDLDRARATVTLQAGDFRLAVVGVADHHAEFAATPERPGTAFADLRTEVPEWLRGSLYAASRSADGVLLSPHWGPNFVPHPMPHVRAAAEVLSKQATLIAGHSAHVFHGVRGNVIYDMGDFLQTYSGERSSSNVVLRALRRGASELRSLGSDVRSALPVERAAKASGGVPRESFLKRKLRRVRRLKGELQAARLRDDLGLLFLVRLGAKGLERVEAVPLKLAHCYTGLAEGSDAQRIHRRFRRACRALGTEVRQENGRWIVSGGAPPT
jgi:poly-gamma-glutamate synthesis protein (capsule biosynthesis protein)